MVLLDEWWRPVGILWAASGVLDPPVEIEIQRVGDRHVHGAEHAQDFFPWFRRPRMRLQYLLTSLPVDKVRNKTIRSANKKWKLTITVAKPGQNQEESTVHILDPHTRQTSKVVGGFTSSVFCTQVLTSVLNRNFCGNLRKFWYTLSSSCSQSPPFYNLPF